MSTNHTHESPLNADRLSSAADTSYFTTPVFDHEPEPNHTIDPSNSTATSPLDSSAVDGSTSETRTSIDSIDSIEFRVIRSGTPVRRLRLTGNRYTFGSAEGCSIRLSDSALRPMHAVLIRDATRVLVRAYSVPIEVNGTRKTEATLQTGDVMRLGGYQFELVAIATASIGSLSSPISPPWSEPSGSIFDRPAPLRQETLSDQTKSPPSTRHSQLPSPEDVIWRERLRREIDQWRERQLECDQREQRCDQRESHLRNRETELWSRAENLYRRESRLQSQESSVLQLHDDFVQRQQELIDLKDRSQTHQEALRTREGEFRRQELEYRGQLEEASRQLRQSQQQAESATQAVARMREQFESLNQQIDELSTQQESLQQQEQHQRQAHQSLRDSLESQRDEAIDAQAKSESLRRVAEARIDEMEEHLERLRSGQGEDLQSKQTELDASEQTVHELRTQVAMLQESISSASEETARLRADYEDACQSVRQLESLVAQSNQRGDLDRESWTAEADELRAAIDQLSVDLARANGEVSQLSEDNASLTTRLESVSRERDEALQRPTHDAFESLREELDSVNAKLADMKSEYEETLDRLARTEADRQREHESNADYAAEIDAVESVDIVDDAVEDPRPIELSQSGEAENVIVDQDDDEVWPTYQMSDESAPDSTSGKHSAAVWQPEPVKPSDNGKEVVNDDSQSDWPADDTTEENSSEAWETPTAWDKPSASDAPPAWDEPSASDAPSAWEESTSEVDQLHGDVDANENEDESHSDPSLASLLIRDLDAEVTSLTDDMTDEADPAVIDSAVIDAAEINPAEIDPANEVGEPVEGTFVMDGDTPITAWNQDSSVNETSEPHEMVPEPHEVVFDRFTDLDDEVVNDDVDPAPMVDPNYLHTQPLVGDPEFQPTTDSPAEPSSPIPTESNNPTVSSAIDDDDDSIEAYMNRLLNRVQATPTSTDSSKPESISLSVSSSDAVKLSKPPEPVDVADSIVAAEVIDPNAPLVPRSHAPERNSDLSAMRKLANETARTAISRSTRIQTRNIQIAGVCNLAVAGVSLIAALLATVMLDGVLLYVAWLMALIIAGISARDAINNFGEAKRRLQTGPEQSDDEASTVGDNRSDDLAETDPETRL